MTTFLRQSHVKAVMETDAADPRQLIWRRYSISEFYAETMRACGLPNGSGS